MSTGVLTVSDTLDVHPFPVEGQNAFKAEIIPSSDQDDAIRARLADVTRQEEKRRRLQAFLERETPAWNPDDHPEIDAAGGASEWVRKIRGEAEQGFKRRTREQRKGMTILLDTSVIIDVLRIRRGRQEFLELRKQVGDTLVCSAVTVAEVYAGMRPGEAAATEELLDSLECIEVTRGIARQAGSLKYAWERKGVTLNVPDAIIAATGLNFNLWLATDNRRDFPMADLKLLDLPSN